MVKLIELCSDKDNDNNVCNEISEILQKRREENMKKKESKKEIQTAPVEDPFTISKEEVTEIVHSLKNNCTASLMDKSNKTIPDDLLKSITDTLRLNASLVTLFLCTGNL